VLGILIAFALDSWWDSWKASEWESGQLELLREEAQFNIGHIASVIEIHERTVANVEAILEVSSSVPSDEISEFRNAVITSLIEWRSAEISLGALDALLASGELGGLKNPVLRKSLAEWKALVLDTEEKENLARDFVEYILTPALMDEDFIAPAYAARAPYGNTNELLNRDVPVRSSARLRSLTAARLGHIRMAIISQEKALEALEEILLEIDSELAR